MGEEGREREGGMDGGKQESDAESAGATRTANAHVREHEREERRWNATRQRRQEAVAGGSTGTAGDAL